MSLCSVSLSVALQRITFPRNLSVLLGLHSPRSAAPSQQRLYGTDHLHIIKIVFLCDILCCKLIELDVERIKTAGLS